MEDAQRRTLVLDQGYAPVGVVSWMDAVSLWFTGKAEIIEEYDGFVRSTSLVIKIPAVIRLINAIRRHRKPVKFSRVNVYARDDYKCQYCGKRLPMDELTYDHVIPRTLGGKTEWTNIVSCCDDCNGKKGGRTPAQARMRLIKNPIQPTSTPSMVIPLSKTSTPDEWRSYLYWTSELDSD